VTLGPSGACSTPLPIDELLPQVRGGLTRGRSLVIQAPPGAGKTTRVPPALLGAGWLGDRSVAVVEPRRVAAKLAASRVAKERGGVLGEETGYQVRLEAAVSRRTRLCYMTPGVLLRRLLQDPELPEIGAVVFDEFHERMAEADLALACLREVQGTIREDLRIVVMSATLDPGPIARYLQGEVLRSAGRMYDVAVEYLPASRGGAVEYLPVARAGAVEYPPAARGRFDARHVVRGVRHLLRAGLSGSMLIFVPGAAEIRSTLSELAATGSARDHELRPLHGDLPLAEQEEAIRRGPFPRIVVATNVAEASITVEGIEAVIDCGLARVARYDAARGMDTLATGRISRASADQRAGRAGRLAPGRCLRLYSRQDYESFAEESEPEIRRVDLTGILLHLLAWGAVDPASSPWLTPPPAPSLQRARESLLLLGAARPEPSRPGTLALTPVGRRMLRFAVPPRHARVLCEAQDRSCIAETAFLVALLNERIRSRTGFDAEPVPRGGTAHLPCDLFAAADLLASQARTARRVRELAASLARAAEGSPAWPRPLPWPPELEERVLRCLLAGHPDRLVRMTGMAGPVARAARPSERVVPAAPRQQPPSGRRLGSRMVREAVIWSGLPDPAAGRRKAGGEGRMVGGLGVRLAPESAVRDQPFLIALDATGLRDRAGRIVLVRQASAVDPRWLNEQFPSFLQEEDASSFDAGAERVAGRRIVRFLDLPLAEKETGDVEPDRVVVLLSQAASGAIERAIPLTDSLTELLERLSWFAGSHPGWPLREPSGQDVPPAPEALRAHDPVIWPLLVSALADGARVHGARSFADLRRLAWEDLVLAAIPRATREHLERLAPARLTLRSGRSFKVRYPIGSEPYLAAPLQEFFGTEEGPSIGHSGRRLILHLLAPSRRPVQVTSDLRSFWSQAYPKLRGELARRYPKHSWPQDPRTAQPPPRRERPGKGPR